MRVVQCVFLCLYFSDLRVPMVCESGTMCVPMFVFFRPKGAYGV